MDIIKRKFEGLFGKGVYMLLFSMEKIEKREEKWSKREKREVLKKNKKEKFIEEEILIRDLERSTPISISN